MGILDKSLSTRLTGQLVDWGDNVTLLHWPDQCPLLQPFSSCLSQSSRPRPGCGEYRTAWRPEGARYNDLWRVTLKSQSGKLILKLNKVKHCLYFQELLLYIYLCESVCISSERVKKLQNLILHEKIYYETIHRGWKEQWPHFIIK